MTAGASGRMGSAMAKIAASLYGTSSVWVAARATDRPLDFQEFSVLCVSSEMETWYC